MNEIDLWQEPANQVERFVKRFENESYQLLANYAALPLVLTPELLHYLRIQFLRNDEVPWEAEADLLLSDLCRQVSYELYSMHSNVRAYLLAQMQGSFIWQERMREVAKVLISYVNYLSRVDPNHRPKELEAQRWAAMTYLGDEACQRVAQDIAEKLKHLELLVETEGQSERGIRSELARLARITQELAPQLKQNPALVEYAKLVNRVLRNPTDVAKSEVSLSFPVGDIDLTVSPRFFLPGQDPWSRGGLGNFPPIKVLTFFTGQFVDSDWSEFMTQTVEVVTLVFATEDELRLPQWPPTITVDFKAGKLEQDPQNDAWVIHQQIRSSPQFQEQLDGDNLVMQMAAIPGGGFLMGSPQDKPGRHSSEDPQHIVNVKPFYMGRYPVTQAQWRFVAGLSQQQRELDPDPSYFKGDMRPVEGVSWYDAVEFCARLTVYTSRQYRLPSEAEWEYACRAGTTTPFSFGQILTPEVANFNGNTTYNDSPKGEYRQETTPVNHFDLANAWGLSDMHGNVWEWCQDHWHENYKGAPSDGSAWLSENEGSRRVIRGGSWNDTPRICRSAYRYNVSPDVTYGYIGFRIVCSAPRTL